MSCFALSIICISLDTCLSHNVVCIIQRETVLTRRSDNKKLTALPDSWHVDSYQGNLVLSFEIKVCKAANTHSNLNSVNLSW